MAVRLRQSTTSIAISKVIPVAALLGIKLLGCSDGFGAEEVGGFLEPRSSVPQAPITVQSLSLCQSDKCNQAAGVKRRCSNLIRVIDIQERYKGPEPLCSQEADQLNIT